MCVGPEVIALTQLAITIAATAQQQEAQRQQISDANKIAQENARLADESYKNQLAQIAQKNKTIRQAEQKEIENAANVSLEQQIQGLEAIGTTVTASGEAGIEGISPGMQISDLERQKINNLNAINRNLDTSLGNFGRQRDNLQFDIQNAYLTSQNQINSMPMQRGLDGTASALQYASGTLDAGTTFYKLGGRYGTKPGTNETGIYYKDA